MKKGLLRTICSISLIAAIFTTMSINASPMLVGINDAALNVKNVTDATRVSSPVSYTSATKKSIQLPLSENKATANSVASVFSEGAVVKTGGEPVNAPLACITTTSVVYSFTSTGTAVQTFTVPANAGPLVTLRAVGAAGGNATGGAKGGRGADVQGDFALSPGTVLYIMTGNVGSNTVSTLRGAGGGGGTFVTADPAFISGLLLAAGGGGGAANASFGSDGRIPLDTLLPSTTFKNAGYSGGPGAVANGGDGGFLGTGGSASADAGAGAAGAGWNSDGSGLGASASGVANTGGIPPYLSTASITSGIPTGGTATSAKGGFGGGANGGNGTAPFTGGGGGGGYSGGGAGGRASASAGTYGGGGGSYNGGTNQVNKKGSDPTTSATITSKGTVTITYSIYALNAPAGVDGSRCGNGTVTLNATPDNCTGAETVDWYDAASGGNLVATGTTSFTTPSLSTTKTYYAQSRNIALGYTSASRTPLTVTVNPIPSVSITPSATTINAGDNVSLTASGATSYTWTGTNGFSGSGATINDSPASTTTYTATGTNAFGCVNTSTVTITVNSLFTPATALNFDGVDDYVSINNTLGNVGTGDFTIEMNVRTGLANTYFFSKRNVCAVSNFISMQAVAGKLSIEIDESNFSNYASITGTANISDNNWHHIALTRKAGLATIYVDGVFNGSVSAPANINNSFVTTLGKSVCDGQNGSVPFQGDMDEVRVWSRALCASELNADKACGLNAAGQTGLVALYHLDQGNINANNSAINFATDATGNNNGTLFNFTLNGATSNWAAGIVSGTCAAFTAPTAPITGATTVCIGSTTTLANANAGTWSSSDNAIATVNASGLVTGVAAGNATITFTNDCGGVSTATVTVNAKTTPTFTQVAAICSGASLSALPTKSNNGVTGTWSPALNNTITTTYTFTPDAGQCALTTTMTITVNVVDFTLSATNVLCNGLPTGSVTVTTTSGTSPFSYSRFGGAFSQASNIFTGLAAGTYSVVVFDANGCRSTSKSINVTQPAAMNIGATGGGVICFGSSTGYMTLNVTGGTAPYTYSKDGINFQASNTLTGLSASTYTFVVKDANACTSSIKITLTQPNVLTLTPSVTDVTCFGGANGSISIVGTGGSPAYSYSKDGGVNFQSGNTFSGLSAGTYNLVIKDINACSATQTVTVGQPTSALNFTANTVSPCSVETNGSITISASNGTAPYTYSIDGGANYQVGNSFSGLAASNYYLFVKDANGCTIGTPFTLVSKSQTVATFTQVAAICSGATLSALPTTSINGITGTWSPALNNTTTTTYTFTPNAGQCATTATMTITVNSSTPFSINSNGSNKCVGQTFNVGASVAGQTYSWTGPNGFTSNLQNISITNVSAINAGLYSVVVTNANGCTSTGADNLIVNALPTATITAGGPTTFCPGGSVTLTASAGTSYLWSNGATTQAITTSVAGSYTVTVTNASNCSATSAPTVVTVQDNVAPVAPVLSPITAECSATVPVPTTTDNCAGTIAGTTSDPLTYNTQGSYIVHWTFNDGNGNSTTVNQTVTILDVTPPTIACPANISVSATSSLGAVVTFAAPVGTDNCPGASTSQTAGLASGATFPIGTTTQTYTVTDAAGHVVSCSFTVTVICVPPVATITASGSTAFCAGGSVTLTASSGSSYLWSNGATTQAITTSVAGSYTVTVTNASGCSAVSAATVVTVNPLPAATITAGGPTSFCTGGSVTLTASAGSSYAWSNGATTQAITTSVAGSYTVTVTNANGCSAKSSATVVTVNTIPSATISAGGPTTFCSGGSVTLTASAGSSYAWSNGATTQATSVTTAGSYSVTVSNAGCSATSAATSVTVNQTPTVNAVSNQVVCANGVTTAINFTGTGSGTKYTWTNSDATIGLSASGNGNIPSFTAINSGNTPIVANVTVTPASSNGSTAYVANYSSNSVSVINTANNALVTTISGFNQPFGAAISPDGTKVYVPNRGNGTVSVISTASNTIISTITTGRNTPSGVVVSADGLRLYVCNENENDVSVVNTTTNSEIAVIGVGAQPRSMAITPDGSKVYVMNLGGGVSVISTSSNSVIASIGVGGTPIGAGVSPDGTRLIVANWGSNSVSIINTATNTVINSIGVQANPWNAKYNLDGTKAYVSNSNSNSVSVINTSTSAIIATIPVGAIPIGLGMTGDGSKLFVTNQGSGNVSVIDPTSNTVTATLTVGSNPFSLGTFIVNGTGVGCTGAATTFSITVNPKPTATIAAVGSTTACPGSTVTLNANTATGNTYQWYKNNAILSGATSSSYGATSTGSYTVVITNSNGCVSAASNAISVTIQDVTAPVTPVLANVTGECSATAPVATTTDACAGPINGTTSDPLTYNTQGTFVIHWTFTDPSGNSTTANQNVIVKDVTPPSITCPNPITVPASIVGNAYGANVTYAATATDNCGSVSVSYSPASGSLFTPGTTQVTATANDGRGNTASCTFNVTVIAPEINVVGHGLNIVKGDVTPQAADDTHFGSTFPGTPITKTFTIQNTGDDNLNVSSINISGVDAANFTVVGPTAFIVEPGSSVTFDVTFSANTPGFKYATVTVGNNDYDESSYDFAISAEISCTYPVITGAANSSVPADNGVCTAVVNNNIVITGIPAPAASYTLSGATTGSGSGTGAGVTYNNGVTTVVVTATNSCGTITATYTVTVNDTQAPTVTAPANVTVNVDANSCVATGVALGTAVYNDNCAATVSNNAPSSFAIGNTTVTWTATDAAGNSSTSTQIVTVVDNIPPSIVCPANQTVTATSASGAVVTYSTPVGTDNCNGATVALTGGLASGSTFPIGSTLVTYTVTDAAGLTATCSFTVVVNCIAPSFTSFPTDQNVPNTINVCGAVVNYAVISAGIPAAALSYTFSGATTASGVGTGSGATFGIGLTTVTVTATSTCGTVSSSFNITVNDTQAPALTAPTNVTVNVDANSCAATNVALGNAVYSDNCSATLSNNAPASFPLGATTVTWTAIDAAGNTTTKTQTVTVLDNIKPTILCPANQDLNLNASCAATLPDYRSLLQVNDNCTATNALVITQSPAAGSTVNGTGSITITFTVKDASNNSSTCSITVNKMDVTPPSITCPQPIAVNNDANQCGAIVTYNLPTTSDNCAGGASSGVHVLNAGQSFFDYANNVMEGQNSPGLPLTFNPTDGQKMAVFLVNGGSTHFMYQNVTLPSSGPIQLGFDLQYKNHYGSFSTNQFIAVEIRNATTGAILKTLFKTNAGDLLTKPMTHYSYDVSAYAGQTIRLQLLDATINNYYLDVLLDNVTLPGSNLVNGSFETGDYTGWSIGSSNSTYGTFGIGSGAGVSLTQTAGLPSGSFFPVGTTTNTFVATDLSGNTSTCSFNVTVTDNQKPTITTSGTITRNNDLGDCGANVTVPVPTTADNCAVSTVVNSYNNTNNATDHYPVGTTVVTWTVTDNHGNSTTTTQSITVVDNERPVVANCPTDVTVFTGEGNPNCSQVATWIAPTASDNCGPVTVSSNFNPGANFPKGSTSVIYTFRDSRNNTSTCTFNVIVIDNTPPVLNCPPSHTVIATSANGAIATYVAPIGTDNCPVVNTVRTGGLASGSLFPIGDNVVTYTATDAAGNTTTCSFTITVSGLPPVITCPGNITVSNDPGNCGAKVDFKATETTAIPASTIVYTENGNIVTPGSYFTVGTHTIVATATNPVGTVSCTFNITVNDTENPVIVGTPVSFIRGTDLGRCDAVVTWTAPTVTDNCSATLTSNHQSGEVFTVGTHTITYTAVDAAGNTVSTQFNITVNDTQAPTVITQNVTVYLDNNGQASITPSQVDNGSSDNCGIATITVSPNTFTCADVSSVVGVNTQTIISDATWKESTTSYSSNNYCAIQNWTGITSPLPSVGSYTITPTINAYSVIPIPGTQGIFGLGGVRFFRNTFNLSSVSDIKATLLSAMDNGVQIFINGVAVVQQGKFATSTFNGLSPFKVILNSTGANVNGGAGFHAYDNITSANASSLFVVGTNEIVLALANCDGVDRGAITFKAIIETSTGGSKPVVLTVTDVHGIVASATANVTVVDNIAPVLSPCPADMNVYATSAAGRTVTYTAPTATDNCSVVVTRTAGLPSGSTFPIGTTHVTYTATDPSGNTVSCSFDVVVQGLPPVITCPGNITVSNDPGNCGGKVSFEATETKAIPASTIVYTENGNIVTPGSYFTVGTHTIVATATNPVGTVSCTFNITVNDTENPSITIPANVTNNCQDSNAPGVGNNGTATGIDNCGLVTISYNDVSTQVSDINAAGNYNYTITRTWTAKDNAGNTSTGIQIITVQDVTAPVITCPANVTLNCQDNTAPEAGNNGLATATDNCSPVNITYSDVSTQDGNANNAGYYNYTITRTWKAVDVSGNPSTCVQTITVQDITAPVITCPANITLNCQDATAPGAGNNGLATATDNCGPVTITSSDFSTQNPSTTNAGYYNYTITRTWKAVDVTGNPSTCVQTITVQDVTAPVITCPANVTLNCQDATTTGGANGTATATDNCGPVTITSSDVSTQNSSTTNAGYYNYTITRTWKATDVSGNSSTCIQTITVQDVTAPVITCPANITLNCQDATAAGAGNNGVATATDNCGPITITSNDVSTKNSNPTNAGYYNYTITRTWTAKDVSGNFSTCVQTITVRDITKPVLVGTLPGNASGQCVANATVAPTGASIAALYSDNCSPVSATLLSTTTVGDNCAGWTRTYTYNVTDVTGNNLTATVVYTGKDNTPPVIINVPANVTVQCPGDVPTAPVLTATDNCSTATVTYAQVRTNGVNINTFNLTRTWTAKDACGNTTVRTQVITVKDNIAPVPTVLTLPTINGQCSASVQPEGDDDDDHYGDGDDDDDNDYQSSGHSYSGDYSSSHSSGDDDDDSHYGDNDDDSNDHENGGCSPYFHAPTAMDNCKGLIVGTTTDPLSYYTQGQHIIHWKFDDGNGNVTIQLQIVNVFDNIAPVPTVRVLPTITGQCSVTVGGTRTYGDDNDDDDNRAGECQSYPSVPTAKDNCAGLIRGTTSNPLTYTTQGTYVIVWSYNDGHGNITTQNQTVIVKDLTAPKPTVKYLPTLTGSCSVTATRPTANDNCVGLVTATTNDPLTYTTQGTFVIHWSYTDGRGNVTTQNQTVVVDDNTKPVITDVADKTISCNSSTLPAATGTPTATDNCSGVVVTYTDAVSGNKITRTWKATDVAGNYVTSTQVITTIDNVAPVITDPADITVNCGTSTLPAATGTATATDNCSTAVVTYTDATSGNKITRTWKATDASGNVSTNTQVITIVDNVAPVITTVANKTINCGTSTAPAATGTATATDNCSTAVVTYSDVTSGNVITRTWKATDGSGNSSTSTQTITIVDAVKPVLTIPSNITINCGSPTTPSGCNSTATATDNCSIPTVTYLDAVNGNVITRTWTATDASGNTVSGTQTITIVDNVKPVLTVPANITVNCGASTLSTATGTATATDNCSTATVTQSDVTNGNVITRTWKATDASGNFVTGTQLITIGSSFSVTVASVPTSSTYTGGVSTSLYIGYGAQSTTLQLCALPAAGAPYTYAWTGSNLSSTTSAAPVFTVSTGGSFTVGVTVTNKFGCKASTSITLCVQDIRVPGTNGAKVFVCHTTKGKNAASTSLQLLISQVSSHLGSSSCGSDGYDRLGSCDQTPCASGVATASSPVVSTGSAKDEAVTTKVAAVASTEEELKVTVMPNPSTTYFTLKLESKYQTTVEMRVMDGNGRVVDSKSKIGANSTFQIGHNYSSGTYYAELIQGTQRKVIQLIKARG